jgi:2,4-dienoyl-CoA reductase-like NADH-dependent reductase (Old Yellow Enzyme family)
MNEIKLLLSPALFRGRVVPNRLTAQAMEINSAGPGGAVSATILERYASLASGGWGIVVVEAVSVTADSLARVNGLVLGGGTLDGFRRLVDSFRAINPDSLFIIQLTHAGRMAGGFSRPVGALGDDSVPMLTTAELDAIRNLHGEAVRLAAGAGFDGVEIKACHGYLGGELLRPANERGDAYGGSAENRARLVSSAVADAKSARPGFIAGARVSLYEGLRGGCGTAGPNEVIEELSGMRAALGAIVDAGADYINVSAGVPALTPHLTRPVKGNAFDLYHHFRYARTVKQWYPELMVVGSAYSTAGPAASAYAEENIAAGGADFAGFGRQNLADPLFPRKLAGASGEIDYCTLCGGCSKLLKNQEPVRCTTYRRPGAAT